MEQHDPSIPQVNPQVNPWMIAVAVMFELSGSLDTTVVNVSPPHIAGSLSTPEEATGR
jgi:hypothetical protein